MTTNERIKTILFDHVNALESGSDAEASARKSFDRMLAVRQALVEPVGVARKNRTLTSLQAAAFSNAINLARSSETTRGQVEHYLSAVANLDWHAEF